MKRYEISKIGKRAAVSLMMTFALSTSTVVCGMEALAADSTAAKEDKNLIEDVDVKFTDNYGDPGETLEPTIETSTADVTVSDIDYSKDADKWTPGKDVRVEITLKAEKAKHFPENVSRANVKLTGAKFIYAEADDNKLTLTVYYTPVEVLEAPTNLRWNANGTTASWKSVDHATGYQVTLYADDKKSGSEKVSVPVADFASKIESSDANYFFFEVQAIPMDSAEKKYLKESEIVTGPENTRHGGKVTGTGANTGASTSSGTTYHSNTNGTGWQLVNTDWYYIDAAGRAAVGWKQINGSWYYFDGSGKMLTGLQTINGGNYFLKPSGEMATGWRILGDHWYYFMTDGRMMTGWVYSSGKMYYLDQYGQMVTNTTVGNFRVGADGAVIY